MPMTSDFEIWATKYLQSNSVIYRMACEFSKLLSYGK